MTRTGFSSSQVIYQALFLFQGTGEKCTILGENHKPIHPFISLGCYPFNFFTHPTGKFGTPGDNMRLWHTLSCTATLPSSFILVLHHYRTRSLITQPKMYVDAKECTYCKKKIRVQCSLSSGPVHVSAVLVDCFSDI